MENQKKETSPFKLFLKNLLASAAGKPKTILEEFDEGIESGEIKKIKGMKEGELEKILVSAMDKNQREGANIKVIESKSYLPLSWFITLALLALMMGAALIIDSSNKNPVVHEVRR